MVPSSRRSAGATRRTTMSAFLYRLGRSCARHPFRVLGLWLVAAFTVVSLQGSVGGEYKDNFRIPGAESQQATDILTSRFPNQSGASSRIVLHADNGRLDDAAQRASIDQARQQFASGHDVTDVTDPFAPGSAALSTDGHTAYFDVAYDITQLTTAHLDDALEAASTTRDAAVSTEFSGQLAQLQQEQPSSDMIGLAVAGIVLLIVFGAGVAMGLPMGTALIGIFVGAPSVGILAGFQDVPSVSKIVCMMVGLGVGIAYALFIVTRHPQNLQNAMDVADAAGTANATAGQ